MNTLSRKIAVISFCALLLACGDDSEGIVRGDVGVCDDCHTIPPAGGRHADHEEEGIDCNGCHACVVGAQLAVADEALHNDGTKNICGQLSWTAAERRCSNVACHGDESW